MTEVEVVEVGEVASALEGMISFQARNYLILVSLMCDC